MTLQFVFPTLPPALDGIGAYTACLADALTPHADVSISTATDEAEVSPQVSVATEAFSITSPGGTESIIDHVRRTSPDWLVVQYNPFSYGKWGLNLSLPRTLRQVRSTLPETRIAIMVHEPFVPIESVRFALMATWQRWQLWQLGRVADLMFFSITQWAERFQSWFPETEVHHLPVGSNIPNVGADRTSIRTHLGYAPETFVVGVFGSGHFSRLLPFIREAVDRLEQEHPAVEVLYIGPAGAKVKSALPNARLHDAGALPDEEVSRHFAAMDFYLAPFRKGVSTRRGSLMVALQHGIPTVSTYGVHTDDLFYQEAERSLLLAPDDRPDVYAHQASRLGADPALRDRIGHAGQCLFNSQFSWPAIAERMLQIVDSTESRNQLRGQLAIQPT